ncbi:DUF87 domain-containing protein [Candidatus Azambacteria bacterium]|nr:DUF87 domain-containing protein [Candidatus Azambacteria bacterium]
MAFSFLKKDIPETTVEIPKARPEAGLQDIIAPAALEVTQTAVRLGEKLARTLFVFSYPRYLNTNWFSPIINLDRMMDIAVFVHPVDTGAALRQLRKKVAQVESQMMIREEKGLVRDPILETAYQDLEALRDRLQQAQEKLFRFGLYLTIYGNSEDELSKIEREITGMLDARLVMAKPALFQQAEGLHSVFPLSNDLLEVSTMMNSGPISSVFPFASAELTSDRGILYGINRHNNSLVLFDRFSLENANMVIFATSGAGKSYAAKLEILRSLMLGTEVLVIDPENEYRYLAETVGGSFFKIALTSPHHLNPFDLPVPLEDESPEEILRGNIINLVGLLRLMLGGLTPEEDAIIDRALTETYAARDITPASDFSKITPPTLSDFERVLESMAGTTSLVVRLKKYTEGTYAGFLNQPTNVEISNRFVVFNIRDMEEELRPIAMYVVLHFIWSTIRRQLKKRMLVVDEAWWMMRHPDGASFLYGIAKRARKYFLGLTTISQDVADFMGSDYGRPILTNSALQLLLKQSPATIETVVKTFNLTDEEKFLLLGANVGEGLFFAGTKHVAIKVVASYTEDQIITTNPEQLLAIEKAKKELAEAEQKTA